jgi:hypothetical protein
MFPTIITITTGSYSYTIAVQTLLVLLPPRKFMLPPRKYYQLQEIENYEIWGDS